MLERTAAKMRDGPDASSSQMLATERAAQPGFNRHLTKPVDPAVLRTVIADRDASPNDES